MKITRLYIDYASLAWRALMAGKDTEGYSVVNGTDAEGAPKLAHINTADYGYATMSNWLNELLKTHQTAPRHLVFALEGQNSKLRRKLFYPAYKSKDRGHLPERLVEFQKMLDMVQQGWGGLGATFMTAPGAEADDLLGYLAEHSEQDAKIITFDNDLVALETPANEYGARIDVIVNGFINPRPYGEIAPHHVTLYKSLVGDSSDDYSGCPGFGDKAFTALRAAYGDEGLEEIYQMMASRSLSGLASYAANPKEHPLLSKIYTNRDVILSCFSVAKIHPEWVNTRDQALEIRGNYVGPVNEFTHYDCRGLAQQTRLVTAKNWVAAKAWLLSQLSSASEVTLDIETYTTDESDDWLIAQGQEPGESVDTYASLLAGISLTFGSNAQFTVYIDVKHNNEALNVPKESVADLLLAISERAEIVIHNTAFELVVLHNEIGHLLQSKGFEGFLPGIRDTKFEASYVNENESLGLKERSLKEFNYQQQTFEQVTQLSGVVGTSALLPGGRLVSSTTSQMEDGTDVTVETRQYKMNELPSAHVFNYGCDDTIMTSALHNLYRFTMELEHTWQVYLDVEIDAAYQHAKNFIDGVPISLETINKLAREDDETYEKAWQTLRAYLIKHEWDGTKKPVYQFPITPAQIKEAFQIVTGKPLLTQIRTLSKFPLLISSEHPEASVLFVPALEQALDSDFTALNDLVASHYQGEPDFLATSPKQKQKLLYEVMKLPIRVRNAPTEKMLEKGITEGQPSTDNLALAYAFRDAEATPEVLEVLKAVQAMAMIQTRRSLFYTKYPAFAHWKDGRIRSNHNQCATNTRRASESRPNKQQLPKHPKAGFDSKFRSAIVPHLPDAVVVSVDFDSQELRLMADDSKDPVLLSCYVGENRRGLHTLSGHAIAMREHNWVPDYDHFASYVENSPKLPDFAKLHPIAKACRSLGKKLNFTAEYGAQATKVAETLLITKEEAQAYLDAREALFVVAGQHKKNLILQAQQTGIMRSRMGAVRHLAAALNSPDRYISSKADRQAVNYRIQGSSAEQTKRAEGAMWRRRLAYRYNAVCYGPIHDEVVWSVKISELPEFLAELHECMVQPYGGMTVPIVGAISFGADFYNQIEVENQEAAATPEQLKVALDILIKREITPSAKAAAEELIASL